MDIILNLIRISHWLDPNDKFCLKDKTGFREVLRGLKEVRTGPFSKIIDHRNSFDTTLAEGLKSLCTLNVVFYDSEILSHDDFVECVKSNYIHQVSSTSSKFQNLLVLVATEQTINAISEKMVAEFLPFLITADVNTAKNRNITTYICTLAFSLKLNASLLKSHHDAKGASLAETTLFVNKKIDSSLLYYNM